MKKQIFFIAIIIATLIGANGAFAQNGYIYTVAGNGTAGYSGDGGLAINAKLNSPTDVCEDHAGNLYIVDQGNKRIRQVNAVTHIITTVAGNGTSGYSGDGGAAISATLNTPNGIVVDGPGNIYIADQGNNVIRKVNTSGIITTIVGTGTAGFSGDGGLASSAKLSGPTSVTVDATGNLYIGDNGNHRIRKVSSSGIITTIAGGGSGSVPSSGGVSATSVSLCTIHNLAVDATGNVYFTNQGCMEYLKVTPVGLIYLEQNILLPWGVSTDIADNVYLATQADVVLKINSVSGVIDTLVDGSSGSSSLGDGGPSIHASLSSPNGVYADIVGNLYIADQGDNRIRMITSSVIATYNAGSFSVFVNEYCSGPQLTIATSSYTGTLSAITNFGDGTTNTSTILPAYSGAAGYITFNHNYLLPGTYSLNTKLMNGTTVVDSITYTYEYTQCVTMPVKFYWDLNGNCIQDSGENFNSKPILVQVDSNGVPVDKISCTSGFYYTAHGAPGDIYAFRVISLSSGVAISCPSSGVIYDTVVAGVYNLSAKYVAVQCPTSGFDLAVTDVVPVTGEHDEWGNIYVTNNYCTPTNATVVLHYDTHYNVNEGSGYLDVYPVPTSYTDSTVTWNVSGLTSASGPVDLYYAIWTDLACCGYLSAGQPIHSYVTVSPTTGDLNPANNICIVWDTVRAGCDPNEMSVTPSGCIPQTSGETPLQYSISFTNVGNDTAFNIYVMDTLSNNIDPKSLRIVMASNTMNTYIFNDGTHNIVKFDFPGINLLDSTVCPLCGGAVVFNVNTLPGLPDGATVSNHAGVFFDYNPVVLTNIVENTVGTCPNTSVKNMPETETDIQLFPNPATDELTIKIDRSTFLSFTISNSIGQEIISQLLPGTNGSTIQANVSVSSLPAGLYYIIFRGDGDPSAGSGQAVVKKFVKL